MSMHGVRTLFSARCLTALALLFFVYPALHADKPKAAAPAKAAPAKAAAPAKSGGAGASARLASTAAFMRTTRVVYGPDAPAKVSLAEC